MRSLWFVAKNVSHSHDACRETALCFARHSGLECVIFPCDDSYTSWKLTSVSQNFEARQAEEPRQQMAPFSQPKHALERA